jgi:hypothetical protein
MAPLSKANLARFNRYLRQADPGLMRRAASYFYAMPVSALVYSEWFYTFGPLLRDLHARNVLLDQLTTDVCFGSPAGTVATTAIIRTSHCYECSVIGSDGVAWWASKTEPFCDVFSEPFVKGAFKPVTDSTCLLGSDVPLVVLLAASWEHLL